MAKKLLVAFVVCLFLTIGANATTVTYFQPTDIGGGIYGSATATITSGPGWLDVVVQNTSALGPMIGGKYANPFITELEFKYLPGGQFTLNESASFVESFSDTLFAKGSVLPALNDGQRTLAYSLVDFDTAGMDRCFMSLEADNQRNDNTIGSLNMLNGSNVPQEGHAVGFLATSPNAYSGTVFDRARFHFVFNEYGTPDDSFYGQDSTLVVKFVGGGDYSYKHVANVPEPATLAILGLGGLLLRKRR